MKTYELMHVGVKGMKWGKRKARPNAAGTGRRVGKNTTDKTDLKNRVKKSVGDKNYSEITKRGKAALDVLMNGDKDWMGNSTSSDNAFTEARNRGKAALERLMYSEKQIDNKKFFGRYNF